MMRSTLLLVLTVVGAQLMAPASSHTAGSPVVRSERAASGSEVKITRVLFFYQEAALTAKKTEGKGDLQVSVGETGLYQFGELLVSEAPAVFLKHGITVSHGSIVPPGEWKTTARKTLETLGPAMRRGAQLVTVSPLGGYSRATRASATVDMTFVVKVVDVDTAREIWAGAIDTSTWNGRDFVMRNFEGTRFNQAYADQFLEVLISKLRSNGFI